MARRLYIKYLCLLFLIQVFGSATCQDSVYFENLTSKEKYVLIVGIENVLKFDPSIDNILFNAESLVRKGSIFKIRPSQIGPVSVMVFSGTAMQGSIDFMAKFNKIDLQKNLEPKVRLGSLPGGGKVTAYELLNNLALRIYVGNVIPSNLEIVSFNCLFIAKNGNTAIDADHKSSALNQTIIDHLKQSKSGDVLMIENVKVKSIDGSLRRVQGLSYQIK